MTGPEHYKEAEALIAEATTVKRQFGEPDRRYFDTDSLQAAQVHATLALAAATIGLQQATDWIEAAG
jgi:hypothetical protein